MESPEENGKEQNLVKWTRLLQISCAKLAWPRFEPPQLREQESICPTNIHGINERAHPSLTPAHIQSIFLHTCRSSRQAGCFWFFPHLPRKWQHAIELWRSFH